MGSTFCCGECLGKSRGTVNSTSTRNSANSDSIIAGEVIKTTPIISDTQPMLKGDQMAPLSTLSEILVPGNEDISTEVSPERHEDAGHRSRASNASFQMIKEHVQQIYDVPPTPICDDAVDDQGLGQLQLTSNPSNLYRKNSTEAWSTEQVRKMENEMKKQLESLNPQDPHRLSIHNPEDISNHISNRDDDNESDSDQDLETPENVFREDSAGRWSDAKMDAVKKDMANQLVHLQASILEKAEQQQ